MERYCCWGSKRLLHLRIWTRQQIEKIKQLSFLKNLKSSEKLKNSTKKKVLSHNRLNKNLLMANFKALTVTEVHNTTADFQGNPTVLLRSSIPDYQSKWIKWRMHLQRRVRSRTNLWNLWLSIPFCWRTMSSRLNCNNSSSNSLSLVETNLKCMRK